MTQSKLSPNETIKISSRGLRGSVAEGIENRLTGSLSNDDQQLIKFHGIYQQDDRDRREERERKKLEPAYSYMVRLRIPGGDITAAQWLGLQDAADKHATGIIKITTRQTVQFHGIVKSRMKPSMQWFDRLGLDSIAACGDVNRNVMTGSHPDLTRAHAEIRRFADTISTKLLPATKAVAEIWLDGKKLTGEEAKPDPLYQDRYLPRKFKIGIAIPPHNDVDVFTQDIGLIAAVRNGNFTGFTLAVGGGLGTTHGNAATYPRLGTVIGYAPKEKTEEVAWHIVAVQRDFGNREDRKQARLKYTIDRMGIDAFKAELERRLGFALKPAQPYAFVHRGDLYGWTQDYAGLWYYTLFVENGRVTDVPDYPVKTAMRVLAKTEKLNFRFTANQNIMLTGIRTEDKPEIETLLASHGLHTARHSATRRAALACVALNTCPLALAEGQRYMPILLTKVEALLEKHHLAQEEIHIRMTGCPNGCARPYVTEIGLIGKSPGRYNLYTGGDRVGLRLNRLYREDADETEILSTLDTLFANFSRMRKKGETFGDFVQRYYLSTGIDL